MHRSIRRVPLLASAVVLATVAAVPAGAAPPGCRATYDTSLQWVARVPTFYIGQAVIRGRLVWMGSGQLRAYDFTDLDQPVLRTSWSRYQARDLVIRDDTAFVIEQDSGTGNYLDVIDIADPDAPAFVSDVWFAGAARFTRHFTVHGGYAYVLVDNGRVKTLDLTDPLHPAVTSTLYLAGVDRLLQIACVGSTAYVATRATGVAVLDLADPANPSWVRTLPGTASSLEAANGLVFVGTNDGALDILDPELPPGTPFVSRTRLRTCSGSCPVVDVEVAGDIAFVSVGDWFLVDVSRPRHPVVLGQADSDWGSPDVEVGDDFVLLKELESGLQVWRRGDDTPSVPCGSVALGHSLHDLLPIDASTVWASTARIPYPPGATPTTTFFDLSDPTTPRVAGEMEKVVRYGDRRNELLVGGDERFVTLDVSRPTAPTQLGEAQVDGGVRGDCLLDGTVAWTGFQTREKWTGVRALDVSDPTHPAVLGELTFPDSGLVRALAIRGDRLYAAYQIYDNISDISTGSLYVIDIADPRAPVVVNATPPTQQQLMDLSIDGDRLWVARHLDGAFEDHVEIYDLSNPDVPALLASKLMGASEVDVEAHAAVAYVTTGARVVACTPDGIRTRGSLSLPDGLPYESRVVGSRLVTLFRAGKEGGLAVSPLVRQLTRTEAPAPDDGRAAPTGIVPGDRPLLLSDGPNPFTDTVRMQIRLPSPAPARVTVLDAAGRLVRTLTDGPMSAGATQFTWDGRDATGALVASGVYFLRMESPGARTTAKVTRLR